MFFLSLLFFWLFSPCSWCLHILGHGTTHLDVKPWDDETDMKELEATLIKSRFVARLWLLYWVRCFPYGFGSLSWICGWFKVSNFLYGRSNIKYFGYLSLSLLLHWLYVVSMVGLWGRKCVSLGNFNLHRITTTEDYSGLGHGYKESRLVPQTVIALINDIFVQWFSHQ